MTTALVAGALANKPGNAGNAWSRLSWVRGLQRLGVEVAFVEQLDAPTDAQRAWFDEVVDAAGWLVSPGEPPPDDLRAAAADADLLLNIGGQLTIPELLRAPRRRVYLDDDPGYTQLWRVRLEEHDVFFTFGANIGEPGCAIPTCGLEWRPTRPPVVLDDWPVVANGAVDRFTTVATWRHPYGRVNGYGQKLDEFRRFIELPRRSSQRFELALDIHPHETPDLDRLAANDWTVVAPPPTPGAFREYVQHSGAEFSAAQGLYVETRSGWFSDRSVRYLASGKPVVVQETGFSRTVPAGEGLVAFTTLDEAVAGVEAVAADPARHARAARALAEEWFDSDAVVGAVLEDALA
jgi:hypothetical protein